MFCFPRYSMNIMVESHNSARRGKLNLLWKEENQQSWHITIRYHYRGELQRLILRKHSTSQHSDLMINSFNRICYRDRPNKSTQLQLPSGKQPMNISGSTRNKKYPNTRITWTHYHATESTVSPRWRPHGIALDARRSWYHKTSGSNFTKDSTISIRAFSTNSTDLDTILSTFDTGCGHVT